MDVLSLIGLAMAFIAIIGGNFLEGGHIGALANGPAALIVFGGTLGAALLQTPISHFKRGLQLLGWAFFRLLPICSKGSTVLLAGAW